MKALALAPLLTVCLALLKALQGPNLILSQLLPHQLQLLLHPPLPLLPIQQCVLLHTLAQRVVAVAHCGGSNGIGAAAQMNSWQRFSAPFSMTTSWQPTALCARQGSTVESLPPIPHRATDPSPCGFSQGAVTEFACNQPYIRRIWCADAAGRQAAGAQCAGLQTRTAARHWRRVAAAAGHACSPALPAPAAPGPDCRLASNFVARRCRGDR